MVASVLLIALSVSLALLMWNQMEQVVIRLAPEVDCYGMEFRAEIEMEPGTQVYYLDVVNLGSLQIEGFYIKSLSEGELSFHEEVSGIVARGATERIQLEASYPAGRYLVAPMVEVEDLDGEQYYKACKDIYEERVIVE